MAALFQIVVHPILEDIDQTTMAEDIDVEAMLEAPYNKGIVNLLSWYFLVKPVSCISTRACNSSSVHPGKQRGTLDSVRFKMKTATLIPISLDDKNNSKENGAASSKENKSSSRRHRSRSRSRSGSRAKRSRSRDKNRRHRSRDRHRGERDRSRSRERREKRRKRSLTPIALPSRRERDRRRSPPAYGGSGFKKIISSPYGANTFGPAKTFPPPRDMRPAYSDDLSPEERDARTIFCMQLSQRIRTRDLEEFFSSVGKVRDVRLITCNKTRRFKGIAYIEFKDPESVPLAMGLNGQKLLGIPIIVQPTQAEKNRAGNTLPNLQPRGTGGPMRLYIGSLHFNITEDMLRGIFEPFGKIDNIQLMVDPDTGRSKGYGFITFHSADDAKKAQEQLNGFELAGRPMKVGTVTDRNESVGGGPSNLDTDEMERAGVDLGQA
ncbi:hypothetical protein M8J75_004257 [Diaphorina citri]|nr:hypothetical protein M8J75_004257 [Diaphorina citri]